ncbi:MAG: prsA, partial [Chlamydiia bacterium]|nr:prsA [Chlamydiia bacterium]
MKEKTTAILVAGSSNPTFHEEVASQLGIPLFPIQILTFPDGECRVQLKGDVAGRVVVILQSLGKKPNEYIVETMLIADALRRAGASRIVLACPYLAYSRQNLAEHKGASLAARLFARFLHEAGISELITLDLHDDEIPGFYDFPVEHLSARKELSAELKKRHPSLEPLVIVGPDLGSAKIVGQYAEEFQSSALLLEKRRIDARRVEMLSLSGEIEGKNVLLADDMCSTAGTIASAAKVCREKGANHIFACVTHGLFVEEAIDRIVKSPIEQLFVSNSIAMDKKVLECSKICVVSVTPTF